jgi:hypothetical protein
MGLPTINYTRFVKPQSVRGTCRDTELLMFCREYPHPSRSGSVRGQRDFEPYKPLKKLGLCYRERRKFKRSCSSWGESRWKLRITPLASEPCPACW